VWVDIGAVSLALTQSIARLISAITLNYYGTDTNLPWGMLVDDRAQRVGKYTDLVRYPLAVTRFHPLGLYEFMLMIFVFVALLFFLLRFKPAAGDTALLYLTLYGAIRFLLESVRVNVSLVLGANISQLTALFMALVATVLLLRRGQRKAE
jgi:prolipoprotein diacylglyceryltransferase